MLSIDTSDGATGLPPMQSELDHALLAMTGASGGEGIVMIPGTEDTLAVKYLHLRGLVRSDPSDPNNTTADWAQTTLAIPVEMVPAVLAAITSA